jgi:hypothetical protein
MKNYKISIAIVTTYLFMFAALSRTNVDIGVMLTLFSFSPFLLIWMVYSILKYGKHSGKTLDNREWGYEDKY